MAAEPERALRTVVSPENFIRSVREDFGISKASVPCPQQLQPMCHFIPRTTEKKQSEHKTNLKKLKKSAIF